MTIAVHINITGPTDDPIKKFNYNCFTILASKYPDDHFIFIFDKVVEPFTITQRNITPVILTPTIRNSLLSHFWYNFKLPRLLNKYNADVFVSKDMVCSSRTNVPQCIILHDLSFLDKKIQSAKSDSSYLKKYLTAFVTKAKKIVATNSFIKDELIKKIPAADNKISTGYFGVSAIFKPGNYAEQESTKQTFTEGREYFLFHVTEATWPNIISMLKAFSAFKKWQKSNMQLVLLFNPSQKDKQIKDFATYKYRNEVKIINTEENETTALLTSAAYAVIYLPFFDISESVGIAALKSNSSLITTDNEFCKALYHDAAVYTVAHEKNISEKMMLLYKDEQLRNSLISKGNNLAAAYTWENTADQLWAILPGCLE